MQIAVLIGDHRYSTFSRHAHYQHGCHVSGKSSIESVVYAHFTYVLACSK